MYGSLHPFLTLKLRAGADIDNTAGTVMTYSEKSIVLLQSYHIGLYRGYTGIMEKKMETTIGSRAWLDCDQE